MSVSITTTLPARERAKAWQVGDLVQVGGVRWIIRTITKGRGIELEALNTSNAGIWWRTTLRSLPKKTSRR